MPTIDPHGGRLVSRVVESASGEAALDHAAKLPGITLNSRQALDTELIATGAFSPLEGFMSEADYRSVLDRQRLAGGLPWTIPVTLAVSEEDARIAGNASEIALRETGGRILATLEVAAIYRYDRETEANAVLLTTSDQHPGVQYLRSAGDYCIAGPIRLLRRLDRGPFAGSTLDPAETRRLFDERGWRTVVAFQTRNPVHRAHEYILRCALETVDGLLLHPLTGDTRGEDVPAEVRLECYRALLANAFPPRHTVLSCYPAAMRYAGPREAIFHAIARKNYGCTHFIVGRDHAGVGNFYGPYDAQKKFGDFAPGELGITPVFFDATFYCQLCGQVASEKTCAHGPESRLSLSGTKVRELLRNGEELPVEFTRPEVAAVLRAAYAAQQ